MKQLILLIYVFSIFGCLTLNAQNEFIYVSVKDNKLKPIKEKSIESNNEKLNKMLLKHKAKYYFQSAPGAKNQELASSFEIHSEGNIDSLYKELVNSKLFMRVAKCKYPELIECSNPVGINDEYVVQGWVNNNAIEQVDAQCAWSITTGDPNLFVAVVDTRFDDTHEDMQDKFATITGNPDSDTHGIKVAGVIAAKTNNGVGVSGIGYNIRLHGYAAPPLLVENEIWNAYLDGAKIINVSWCLDQSYVDSLIAVEITQNGVLLVVGAGNDSDDICSCHIADIPGVLDVSSVDWDDNHGTTGHAHNEWVDICAPGINVTTTFPNNAYSGGWGTSYATPIVSGVAALMLSINPCLTPTNIENIIKETADPILDATQFPGLVGAGRVNAYEAVRKAGTIEYIDETITGTQSVESGYAFYLEDVTIGSGANITLTAKNKVEIEGTFSVPLGSTFSVNINSNASFCN